MKVLKFGGSSVANAERILKVIEIVRAKASKDICVVVLSAMQGVTDNLIEISKKAEEGNEIFRQKILDLRHRHENEAKKLLSDASNVISYIDSLMTELKNLCEGIYLLRELTPRTLDRILSLGELLSSRIFYEKIKTIEANSIWKDARELIRTDSAFGAATVEFNHTNQLIQSFFKENEASIYIVPGFIAADMEGTTTTLGRGGSDYTAAIIASALNAEVLEIWTDVSGMMTADPRIVKNARQIPHISYREAMELSHFGAKVIYPPTLQPVMSKNIPVWVKNTFAPEDYGTLIEAEVEKKDIVTGISSIDKIAVLNLEGSGMVGIPGFSKRFFSALAEAKINVILITQGSSEHSICAAIEERFAKLAKQVVDKEFADEISSGKIEPLRVEKGFSILALVGDRMRLHPGISGKMFSALGWQGVNIHAIAQGSSERNISAVVSSKDVKKAINALHEEFFSKCKKQINLFIAGIGNVGGKFIEQIDQQKAYLSKHLGLNVRIIGIANSKKILFDDDGIDAKSFRLRLENSELDSNPQRFANEIIERNLRNSIFVDITADTSIIEIYPQLLQKSISIVACNKAAASSRYEKYRYLRDLAKEYNAHFLFETNVGAGLPVISTLNDLLRSGDEIFKIEAILSGTLQFVFNNYDTSKPFASVVKQAQELGYTEPDPRIDLSGMDVARKILILAREAGYKLELEDIENRAFLPDSCFTGSVENFYEQMYEHEEYFRSLFNEANRQGKTLRYVACMNERNVSVGIKQIDKKHEFALLSGKDNAILFYTKRYSLQPLVIKGAGAGAEVTAAGIFADVIRAANLPY